MTSKKEPKPYKPKDTEICLAGILANITDLHLGHPGPTSPIEEPRDPWDPDDPDNWDGHYWELQ